VTAVALLGGSGRLGGHVLERLLNAGCSVRALCHRNALAIADPGIELVHGDARDPSTYATLLDGAELVVSTLGNASAPVPDVCSGAIACLVTAMRERGLQRIVSTTGSAARLDREIGHEHRWLASRRAALMRHMAPLILDAEAHMRMLTESPLSWTVVRAPIMLALSGAAGVLASSPAEPDATLGYGAVAGLLVAELLAPRWIHAAPFAVPA